MERVAALPMYDLLELQGATDGWWRAIAERLSAAGIEGVPASLDRRRPATELWSDPALLLAQACGYPVVTFLQERVRVVATPSYRAEGCGDGTYRSRVVVPKASWVRALGDIAGSRVVINDRASHSGMNALRALVAPHARGKRFFRKVTETGSHRASLATLRAGTADVACIDEVTYALIGDVAPEELEGIRVVALSGSAPCLPYVTAKDTTDEEVEAMRHALTEAVLDPALAPVRDRLRIESFAPADAEAYAQIRVMEEEAKGLGYPHLM